MASSLSVTTQINSDTQWEITAFVLSGGSLPTDIFLYSNTGTTTLGEYQGVCSLEEYQRYQTLTTSNIPRFGNNFVKSTQAKIKLDINTDISLVILNLENTVKALSLELINSSSATQIIPIP